MLAEGSHLIWKRKGPFSRGHLNYLAVMCQFVLLVWNLLLCTVSYLSTKLSIVWETKSLRTYRQACVLSVVWNFHVKKEEQ